jgi:hypothetical protein
MRAEGIGGMIVNRARTFKVRNLVLAASALTAAILLAPAFAAPAAAQGQTPPSPEQSLTEKMNAYVGCINRLSERAYESRKRYASWAAKSGPTGNERIVYGTYTIYDTSDCRKNVEKANAIEPRDPALEAAASAYADAVSKLEPLLKEADDYYDQQDYKDDRMAKGRDMHPKLVAAWEAFANADEALRRGVEAVNDKRALERLAAIEQKEGRNARFHVEAVMIDAKRLLRSFEPDKPDLAAIAQALNDYEANVRATDKLAESEKKIGSMFVSEAKSFLTTAKQLMRRIRDKTPYSQGDRMMINAGSGWMIEGSPQRLMRDYNELIGAYNRGARI